MVIDILKALSHRRLYVYFCAMSIVTVLVYYPSFSLFFSGLDISKYFLETQSSSFRELMTDYLSWSIVGKYARGDTYSFRPFAVMLLGLERYLFGTRYVLWQIANIIMHLGVVLCLYRLLVSIRAHIFAWLLCFLFSIYAIFARVITWASFGNYFIYLTLVLIALYHLYNYTFGKEARHSLFWVFLCMLLGCFFYETGIVYCLLFVVYLAILKLRKARSGGKKDFSYLIILIPVFAFLLAYSINLFYGRSWLMEFEVKRIVSFRNIMETTVTVPKIFLLWIGRGFFLDYTGGRFSSSSLTMAVRYALLIFSVFYMFIALRASRVSLKRNWLLMLLVFTMMIVHVAINCLARLSTHGIGYLLVTKQTTYIFWAFLIVFIYLAIDFKAFMSSNRLVYYTGVVGLSAFILFNAVVTYGLNRIMQAEHRDARMYADKLYQFIEGHRREEGFSFAVASSIPWGYAFSKGYADPKGEIAKGEYKEFSLHEIFFGEYYNEKNPKYVLEYDFEKNKIKVRK